MMTDVSYNENKDDCDDTINDYDDDDDDDDNDHDGIEKVSKTLLVVSW